MSAETELDRLQQDWINAFAQKRCRGSFPLFNCAVAVEINRLGDPKPAAH